MDDSGRNAAMVDKLRLPFPLLSDPEGEGAIQPFGVWHAEREIARPAVVVVSPQGEEAFRWVSRDYADRLPEDDLLAAVRDLDLPATEQEAPTPGEPQPGPRAMPAEALRPYFRGARFAVQALRMRHGDHDDDLAADAEAYVAQVERFSAAVRERLG